MKALTASDVYLKYSGHNGSSSSSGGSNSSDTLSSSATKQITEALKNHPLIVQGRGVPVKVTLLEKTTEEGHQKYLTVTVKSRLDKKSGRRTLEIKRMPDEMYKVSLKGPWECR